MSDKPANAVKVYNLTTGDLISKVLDVLILRRPVQLLIHRDIIYIGCADTSSIVTVDLVSTNLFMDRNIILVIYIDGGVDKTSGMTFDD